MINKIQFKCIELNKYGKHRKTRCDICRRHKLLFCNVFFYEIVMLAENFYIVKIISSIK